MSTAVKIETTSKIKQELFIPSFPQIFLRQILPAGDAIAILLIAMAEMRMQGLTEVALSPALWAKLGNPSRRIRSRLLKQISKLPPPVCTLEARSGRPHLLRTGSDWPVKKITNTKIMGR